jgi:hypothetical protein
LIIENVMANPAASIRRKYTQALLLAVKQVSFQYSLPEKRSQNHNHSPKM